jgi:hypothetical protein
MKLFKKEFSRDDLLYGGFIITFTILYAATAFVSWYHAITFFNIANASWLSVILSFVAEIGQASALFSILLTKNSSKWLTWAVMTVLTLLQVIGNVDSSYAWIIAHGAGVEAFRKSILFWVQTENTDTFKIIIAWITGALLPVIALSMTALVAQNLELRTKKIKTALDEDSDLEVNPEVNPEWTKENILGINPEHENFVEEQSKINESLISDPDVKKSTEPVINADESPISSPDVKNTEPVIDAKDIISEVSRIRPSEEDLAIVDHILKSKIPKEAYLPDEVVTKNEEQAERLLDEQRMKDDLDKDVAELTPEITTEKNEIIEAAEQIDSSKQETSTESLPIVIDDNTVRSAEPEEVIQSEMPTDGTPILDYVPEPLPKTTDEQEEKKRIEEERLERIRNIARENIKKKS